MSRFYFYNYDNDNYDIRLSNIDISNFSFNFVYLSLVNYIVHLCFYLNINFVEIGSNIKQIIFNNIFDFYFIDTDNKNINKKIILKNNSFDIILEDKLITDINLYYLSYLESQINKKRKFLPRFDTLYYEGKFKSKSLLTGTFINIGITCKEGIKILQVEHTGKKLDYKDIFYTKHNYSLELGTCCLVIYELNTKAKIKELIPITNDGHFQSLYYYALPTPKINLLEDYKNNNLYYYKNKSHAIAIDPNGSKDRDDAINFELSEDKLILYVHIADIQPYLNIKNQYPFLYAIYKQETDYLIENKISLIDSRLSDNLVSLSGKRNVFTVKIEYKIKDNKLIINQASLYLESDLTIYSTSYQKVSELMTNYKKDLKINDSYDVERLEINNKKYLTINPEPNQIKNYTNEELVDIFEFKPETKNEIKYCRSQFDMYHKVYKLFIQSLEITNEIKPFIHTKQYNSSIYKYNLREEWLHRLIEITALEANKYIALIQLLNKTLTKSNPMIILSEKEIVDFNNLLNNKSRFYNKQEKIEGIFRGLNFIESSTGILDKLPTYFEYDLHRYYPKDISYNEKSLSTLLGEYDYYLTKDKNNFDLLIENLPGNTDERGIATYTNQVRPHLTIKTLYYTHFTSPMRRSVDLLIQNILVGNNKELLIDLFRNNHYQNNCLNQQLGYFNNELAMRKLISNNKYLYGCITKDKNSLYIYFPSICLSKMYSITSDEYKEINESGIFKIVYLSKERNFRIFKTNNKKLNNGEKVKQVLNEIKTLFFKKERFPEINTWHHLYLTTNLLLFNYPNIKETYDTIFNHLD